MPETPSAARPDALSVSQLVRLVRMSLEDRFRGGVWVAGEISNLRRQPSGHVYFTIKDATAQFPAILWRSEAAKVRFDLADGLEVFLLGEVTLYEPMGKAQLKVLEVQPKGVGALELAFRQLKEKLEREGLFDPARKRPLPRFPERIGIVTSPVGAAIRDLIRTITDRWGGAQILLCPVRVQGEGAAAEIARAIGDLNRARAADVMIVGRGGGSLEDLWAFNEEAVARAIVASEIPVISAVGHEVDVSISDLVADWRAPTPTAAGERVAARWAEAAAILDRSRGVLRGSLQGALALAKSRLSRYEAALTPRLPARLVAEGRQRADGLAEALSAAAAALVSDRRRTLDAAAGRLEALSPLKVLERGYSVTRDASGRILRRAADARAGSLLRTQLGKGTVVSRVEEIA